MHIHTHTLTSSFMSLCSCCMSPCVTCMNPYIYIYIYIYIYMSPCNTCMNIYIYIYTYAHTYAYTHIILHEPVLDLSVCRNRMCRRLRMKHGQCYSSTCACLSSRLRKLCVCLDIFICNFVCRRLRMEGYSSMYVCAYIYIYIYIYLYMQVCVYMYVQLCV